MILRRLTSAAILFLGISHAQSVIVTKHHGRQLGLEDSWAISLKSAEKVGEHGVALTFEHGKGGNAGYMIYGKIDFDATIAPIGETCLSMGGGAHSEPAGMVTTIVTTDLGETFESVVTVETDKASLGLDFLHQGDSLTVIQYCVRFFLENGAGEEATTLETEIRIGEGQSGSISVDSFGTDRSEAMVEEFSSMVTAVASICGTPSVQGEIVSICVASNDGVTTIDGVSAFRFKTMDGDLIEQDAFVDGAAQTLTEEVDTGDASFKFNTILRAGFYMAGSITVVGEGYCTMSGRRRLIQFNDKEGFPGGVANSQSEPEQDERDQVVNDVPVNLAFFIDNEGNIDRDSVSTDASSKTESNKDSDFSASVAMSMAASVIALVVLLLAVKFFFCRITRSMESEEPKTLAQDDSESVTAKFEDEATERFEEMSLQDIRWV